MEACPFEKAIFWALALKTGGQAFVLGLESGSRGLALVSILAVTDIYRIDLRPSCYLLYKHFYVCMYVSWGKVCLMTFLFLK